MQLNTERKRVCFAGMSYDGPSVLINAALKFPGKRFGEAGRYRAEQVQKLDLAFEGALKFLPTETMEASVLRTDGARYQRLERPKQITKKLHHWASVGKMVTALGILVLKEQGRLKLDAPISDYVSGVPEGRLITLEMLLNHTSGLFSANEDLQVRSSGQILSLPAEIAVLQKHGNLFCPGTNWRYSNSGYMLLAEVIKQVSGQSYTDFVMGHVIGRTSAKNMRVMTAGERPKDIFPLALPNGKKQVLVNHFGGAGSVVGDAESLATFLVGVLEARVVSKVMLGRMTNKLYPMFQSNSRYYGLGIMAYQVGKRDHQTGYLFGHTGGLGGASAFVGWSARHQAIVTVVLTGRGSAEYSANKLFKALE